MTLTLNNPSLLREAALVGENMVNAAAIDKVGSHIAYATAKGAQQGLDDFMETKYTCMDGIEEA